MLEKILLYILFFLTLCLIFLFPFARKFVFKIENNRLFAMLGVFLGAFLGLYLLFMVIIFLQELLNKNAFAFLLTPFIFMPFIIGKFATFKKLDFYTNLQTVSFVLSLFVQIMLL